jgi:hypothetical protein
VVVLTASVIVFVGVLLVMQSIGWKIGGLIFLAAFWFLGLEAGPLPEAIEWFLVRRARKTGKPVSDLWFVDLDQEERERLEGFHRETEDNPTLR